MIIGLSGYAQSGKDTVAELLCLNYGYTRMSFAQPMRDAIYTLNPIVFNLNSRVADLVDEYGWDVAKANPEVRRLLQVFGTEVGRKQFGENFWVQQAFDKLESTKIVFADVRFPNEANEIIQYGGQVWRVNRHNHAPVNGHKSEHAMDNFMFKHVLYNDGTLDDLSDEVFMLAKELGL
jgi:hypothetical protein